ncbi:YopX family protein [Listeria monocytogenes]
MGGEVREIEFRAWDKEVKEMDYNPSVIEIWQNKPINEQFRLESEEKLVWMQYTGLKDKNGNKIFEGDIGWDEHNECYGVVKFEEGKFLYVWENIAEDLWEVADCIEICGNIHENPELLEGTE